ncbi:hypothetical protein KP509_35G047700 [Ceratopteris richardii]|uniref:Uncharacterized protein n=1 Tax=Ceratopteris richardii TaxID=49495 RepID=A0A8T2QF65_CERRI|nr:hypothetical protein KP509_35G047700 [Ceratopteris richardii]
MSIRVRVFKKIKIQLAQMFLLCSSFGRFEEPVVHHASKRCVFSKDIYHEYIAVSPKVLIFVALPFPHFFYHDEQAVAMRAGR